MHSVHVCMPGRPDERADRGHGAVPHAAGPSPGPRRRGPGAETSTRPASAAAPRQHRRRGATRRPWAGAGLPSEALRRRPRHVRRPWRARGRGRHVWARARGRHARETSQALIRQRARAGGRRVDNWVADVSASATQAAAVAGTGSRRPSSIHAYHRPAGEIKGECRGRLRAASQGPWAADSNCQVSGSAAVLQAPMGSEPAGALDVAGRDGSRVWQRGEAR